MKPFLTNKGCLENDNIILLDGEEMIANDRILAKRFNEHYINLVEVLVLLSLPKCRFL